MVEFGRMTVIIALASAVHKLLSFQPYSTMKNKAQKKNKAAKPFVFIVDSHATSDLYNGLTTLGLKHDEDYEITGAGGASVTMQVNPSWLKNERLLIFMSSFHGAVEPAVQLAREIKAFNPKARLIFWSTTAGSSDPVFEQSMGKDDEQLLEIVKEFLAGK